MKVYRGPKRTAFNNLYDDYAPFIKDVHKLVDEIDLKKINNSWICGEMRITIEISKNAKERSAVINIVLTEEDVIELNRGLINRLLEELKEMRELTSRR